MPEDILAFLSISLATSNIVLWLPTLRQTPNLPDAQVKHDSVVVKWNPWSSGVDGAGDGPDHDYKSTRKLCADKLTTFYSTL